MKNLIFNTENNLIGFILRITLGVVIFSHGAQKLLGAFGGFGFEGTMNYFTQGVHLPWIIGFLVIIIESIGSLSIIVGFASRAWAVAMSILMVGIILTVHAPYGFFMNWFGNQKGEGFEYFLLALGISLALILTGSGKYSVDMLINKKASK